MKTTTPLSRRALAGGVLLGLLAGSLLFASSANAEVSGPTTEGEICMQKVFGTPVTGATRLNCTANDIRLSKVVTVAPDKCTRGARFDVTATFLVDVTANNRYDPGFFFRKDGGLNARGDGANANGECSLSGLDPDLNPGLNLDGDTCGDLNAGQVEVSFTIPDVVCEDSDDDGKLNLPYCTSWHSNQGTACAISDPFSAGDAFGFKPDTKSKCVCDDNFELPVEVEDATITVEKTATPTSLDEPGGQVTFDVKVTNDAEIESVVIRTLDDDLFGNLADEANENVTDNGTCVSLKDTELGPGAMTSCSFKADLLGEPGDDPHVNTVTVCASQPPSTTPSICDEDDAEVTFIDVAGNPPTLMKTAMVTRNCRMDVDYRVVINNNSAVDDLRVDTLTDNMFGEITEVQGDVITACTEPGEDDPIVLPVYIAPLSNLTCDFTARIEAPNCTTDHTNTVTAAMKDDDNVGFDADDTARVKLNTYIDPEIVP